MSAEQEVAVLTGIPQDTARSSSLAEQLGYSKDSILVIVHADDIGMHRNQTDGALDCMRHGMCQTGSVMVPCPDFERVVGIWKEHPELDLGIHLTLNSEWGAGYGWRPVLSQDKAPSLYSPDGIMWPTRKELRENLDLREALLEYEAQIRRGLEAGLEPTHIDGHMEAYSWHPRLVEGVMSLSRKYNLPMLPGDTKTMREAGYVFPDTTHAIMYISGENRIPARRKKAYDRWLRGLGPGVHWICMHASFMTEDFANRIKDGYVKAFPGPRVALKLLGFLFGYPDIVFRKGDYAYWTSPKTKALAQELGIKFIGCRELQKLQERNWE